MINVEQILKEFSSSFNGEITPNKPIAPKTTFKIGGNAELFLEPADFDSLILAVKIVQQNNLPYFVLGGGSNIVFTDDLFNGVVISTGKLNQITLTTKNDDFFVECQAGASISSFTNFCIKNELDGIQEFAGLPGSVGGAIYMNARCFEKSICQILHSVCYLDKTSLSIKNYSYNSEDWAYKKSPFQDSTKLVLSSTFALKKCFNIEELKSSCKFFINERVSKGHFAFPSAGSVFKNNHEFGLPSGKIIDNCELKGFQIGGAQVAPFHGNFIINTGNATFKDVKNLVEHVKSVVKNKYNFILEPEIIFVDNLIN